MPGKLEAHRKPTRRAVAALTVALIFTATLGLVGAVSAWASDPFPVEETFEGSAFGPQWRHGGSAELTGSGEAQGWLRLTSAQTGEFGYAYDDEAFPSADGALVEFEYADWGGSGADGLTFFLFNGATTETEFHAGQPGGSLGYAPCYGQAGLSNAYVGVGFDEYGNFTNLGSICGLDGTEFLPNHVSIRGSEAEDYKLLATAATSESLRAERSQARHVTISITPTGKLSVYIRYPDGTYQKVTEGFQLPAAPEKLKFGYVASTGSLTDNHEIRGAQVVKPTELKPSVTQTAGGHERGKPLTWTATVLNEGPNPTQREQLRAATGEQSLSNASWTCEASGGAECVTASGTGLPSTQAGAMPKGSSLIYKITGTPTPATDYAQMTVESEPRGDTGELDPEKERATAKTNLTPLFDENPSFTLTADGEANASTASALGGEVAYSYAWQRCEPNGTECTNIAGTDSTVYHTTSADLGHELRFAQTAVNGAGSATADSAVYEPLPAAEIASAPARYVASREAVLSFTASIRGATLECSLDGAAWSECSSPKSYTGLANGKHTFSVRAVYGGLTGPDPAMAQWTVEATPPSAPAILSAPSPSSTQTNATFKFDDLTEGDTLECRLDGGEWSPCKTTSEFSGLSYAQHQLQIRQVNRAGVDSSVTSYSWNIAAPPPPRASAANTTTNRPGTATASVTSKPAAPTQIAPAPARVAPKHRRAAKHKHKERRRRPTTRGPKTHRLAARHNASPPPTARTPKSGTTGRVAPTPRSTAPASHGLSPGNTHRPATKHTPKTERSPAAMTPSTRSTDDTHAPRAAQGPKDKSRTPPTAQRPKDKAQGPSTAQPRDKTSPSTKAHKPNATARRPTDTRQPESGPPSSSTSTEKSRRHDSKSAPRTGGTPRVAPTSRSEAAPAPGRKSKGNTPTPAAPTTKAKKPATKIAATDKAPAPAVRAHGHTHHHKIARHDVNPVIWPFKPQSSALVGSARRLVERIAAELKTHARRIVCVGYTDDLGTRSSNLAIGLERARTVCAKLRVLGVHASFKAESRGEEQPRTSNATAAGRALNRRVELRVAY